MCRVYFDLSVFLQHDLTAVCSKALVFLFVCLFHLPLQHAVSRSLQKVATEMYFFKSLFIDAGIHKWIVHITQSLRTES